MHAAPTEQRETPGRTVGLRFKVSSPYQRESSEPREHHYVHSKHLTVCRYQHLCMYDGELFYLVVMHFLKAFSYSHIIFSTRIITKYKNHQTETSSIDLMSSSTWKQTYRLIHCSFLNDDLVFKQIYPTAAWLSQCSINKMSGDFLFSNHSNELHLLLIYLKAI